MKVRVGVGARVGAETDLGVYIGERARLVAIVGAWKAVTVGVGIDVVE